MSTTRTVFALVTGLVAGTALGMLMAPASGSTSRKKLLRKGRKWRSELADVVEQSSDRVREAVSGNDAQARTKAATKG